MFEGRQQRMDSLISIGNDIAYTLIYYDGGDELYIGTAYGLVIYDIVGGKKVFHLGIKKERKNSGNVNPYRL
jgi:hypothetical protein